MVILDPAPTRIDVGRVVLAVVGIGLIGVGGIAMLAGVPVARYPGVLLWLALAVVLHDGVLAPLVVAFGVLGRPFAAGIGPVATAVARSALVIAALASLIAIPGLVERATGPRNATVHTIDYATVLLVCWLAAVVIAIGAAVVGAVVSSRRRVARTK